MTHRAARPARFFLSGGPQRGSRVNRDFACTSTRHFSPVLVALRSQSRLRLEGRTRTLSGPSPDIGPARTLVPSACMPTALLLQRALSAWEVCGAVALPPADFVTCGDLDGLSASDRDYPRALLLSGTQRHDCTRGLRVGLSHARTRPSSSGSSFWPYQPDSSRLSRSNALQRRCCSRCCSSSVPLRPELAAPLGVWPLSQLAECADGRRCWRLCEELLYFRAVRSTALAARVARVQIGSSWTDVLGRFFLDGRCTTVNCNPAAPPS